MKLDLSEKSINSPKRQPIDKSKYELILDNQSLIRHGANYFLYFLIVVAIDCETDSIKCDR